MPHSRSACIVGKTILGFGIGAVGSLLYSIALPDDRTNDALLIGSIGGAGIGFLVGRWSCGP